MRNATRYHGLRFLAAVTIAAALAMSSALPGYAAPATTSAKAATSAKATTTTQSVTLQTRVQVVGGTRNMCDLTAAGAVRCWGSNTRGELGTGAGRASLTAVSPKGLTSGVAALASGNAHTCALTTRGALKCWGSNTYGQLGTGNRATHSTPVTVIASGVQAVDAGRYRTCAVVRGAVQCWGEGTGTSRPRAIRGLAGSARSVSVGADFACALLTSGAVQCWGKTTSGQLGSASNGTTPRTVTGLTKGVASISSGYHSSCALTTTHALRCWGDNSTGQVGGTTAKFSRTPVTPTGLGSGVSAVAVSWGHACVVTTKGAARCWGGGSHGELGTGHTTKVVRTPTTVAGLSSGVAAIGVGPHQGCAVKAGSPRCWGDNEYGQLGDSTTTRRTSPVAVITILAPKITKAPSSGSVSYYGIGQKAYTFSVGVSGSSLRYTWQYLPSTGGSWQAVSGGTASSYTAQAGHWAHNATFRVVVSNAAGTVTSPTAKLTVLWPTNTPARDAEKAFGLKNLAQGVDLSAYQYSGAHVATVKAVAAWSGTGGFALLRQASGNLPINRSYTSTCTGRPATTGSTPVYRDCAYATFSDEAKAAGLRQGGYWFNGWISSIDTTPGKLFANGYTPQKSAAQFVSWLLADGNYTRSSTDPLVLDIEPGGTWTQKSGSKSYTLTLRAWTPAEAQTYLNEVKRLLGAKGYHANLYVYMNASTASSRNASGYTWSAVAASARLWVASYGINNGRIPASQPTVGPWASHGGWSIWQYTDTAPASGWVDGDIAKADAWTPR